MTVIKKQNNELHGVKLEIQRRGTVQYRGVGQYSTFMSQRDRRTEGHNCMLHQAAYCLSAALPVYFPTFPASVTFGLHCIQLFSMRDPATS